jgi:hypothetical protein
MKKLRYKEINGEISQACSVVGKLFIVKIEVLEEAKFIMCPAGLLHNSTLCHKHCLIL